MEVGRSSESPATVQAHAHQTGSVAGKEGEETLPVVTQRDREKTRIRREVLSVGGKGESWRTAAMGRMGKFSTQEGEEGRAGRRPAVLTLYFV